MEVDLLVFHRALEALHEHVVTPATLAVHADGDAGLDQHVREGVARELRSLVGVEDLGLAVPDERFLILQMHELLSYLSQMGVVAILLLAQHGLVGPMETPVDISYLSDAVLMLLIGLFFIRAIA